MTSHDLQCGTGPRADWPKRRAFTTAFKLQIVEEYDAVMALRGSGFGNLSVVPS
ncbi:hypothetical protein [Nonomuraea rosea]|uniref:hypothetical protein n=1 Tax=Nonomuraea rosea TaxID=638574 RepID=UPI0031E9DD19